MKVLLGLIIAAVVGLGGYLLLTSQADAPVEPAPVAETTAPAEESADSINIEEVVEEAVEDASEAAEQAVDQVQEAIEKAIDQAPEAAEATADAVEEVVEEAAEAAADAVSNILDGADNGLPEVGADTATGINGE